MSAGQQIDDAIFPVIEARAKELAAAQQADYAAQADWYVSFLTGDDANDGRDPATPKKTIGAALAALKFGPAA